MSRKNSADKVRRRPAKTIEDALDRGMADAIREGKGAVAVNLQIVCHGCGARAPQLGVLAVDDEEMGKAAVNKIEAVCPTCGTTISSDQSPRLDAVVSRLLAKIKQSKTPYKDAKHLLEAYEKLRGVKDLNKAKRSGALSKLRGLVPSKPEHVAIYMGVVLAILSLVKGCGPEQVQAITEEQVLKKYDEVVAAGGIR